MGGHHARRADRRHVRRARRDDVHVRCGSRRYPQGDPHERLTEAQDRLAWRAEGALNAVVMKRARPLRRLAEGAHRTGQPASRTGRTQPKPQPCASARTGGRRWMTETTSRRRGNSKPNVKRRGSTYTYYLYVTESDGRRRQHSKGGFRTQREAEDARIAAAHALATGSYVKAERISLADFLIDEWLPSRRPPVLEESTWHSYDRYLRLHVIPHIGAVPLQKLSRRWISTSSTADCSSPAGASLAAQRRRPSAVRERAVELRASGPDVRTDRRPAPRRVRGTRRRSPRTPSRRCLRRTAEPRRRTTRPPGLAPRTVRYIHTIIHAALQGRAAMEPRRPQRRRCRHSPVGGRGPFASAEGVDSRAASGLPRLRRRQPVPAGVDLPRHERLPAGRVPRSPLERHRPRRRRRRSSPAR